MSIKHWYKDRDGHIAGATDDEGYTYDSNGNWTGRVSGGEVHDKSGSYMGNVDDSGRIYDRGGHYAGKVRDDGWVEDANGNLLYKK